ncbi:MAG: transglycosylase SLT domain-containing protein [Desulfomicrobium sp.]|nr:transglycosylase SLT domain-containing protein [Desulfomicrobium sp.]
MIISRILVFVLMAALGCMISAQAHASGLEYKRQIFIQAEEALSKGQHQDYLARRAELGDYPLLPYLTQQDLEKRMQPGIAAEVRSFLRDYDGTPPAEALRRPWLAKLAENGHWNRFVEDYRPQKDENLQCFYGQALLNTGKRAEAKDQARALWLSGSSRPKTCDPLFEAWINEGGLTRELTWQRIELAMQRGQDSLARHLRRHLAPGDAQWLDYWLRVDQQPALVLERDWSTVTHDRGDAILAHAMRKMTRGNATRAAADWNDLRRRSGLDRARFAAIENDAVLYMSLRFEPGALVRVDSIPEDLRSDSVREWAVRAALRAQDWPAALRMLESLTAVQKEDPRWRYWQGRALQENGRDREAREVFETLSGGQDYFAMLALGHLGRSLVVQHDPLTVSDEAVRRVGTLPALQRAAELYALGRYGPARREWQQAQPGLDAEELAAAAAWAHGLGWHDRAIVATAAAGHMTDLELRFPLPHKEIVFAEASATGLRPALVYGVTRQESLFMSDVGSSAGALGLMQIMPQTGKRIAGWHGEKLSHPMLLLQPERNIRYGTTYLRRQLDDLQNHPFLATAAYNAGQSRVKGWLPSTPMPADVWVETIPFNETRNYVEKVAAYTAIYETRLGKAPEIPGAGLPLVRPRG